jgi:ABC-type multidrug transport system ATPase subunit
MNGKERNLSLFRKLSAYIMQDNQLHANLTVEEAMNVAANLKLSQNVQRVEKMSVVSTRSKFDDECVSLTHTFVTKIFKLNL